MLKCSCASIFTCFVDYMLTCVLALVIMCSHVFVLGCLNAHVFISSHTWLITCSYVYLLWWLHVYMSTCFDNSFNCFHVCMLWWSYAPMSICFNYHMPTFVCALMLICLDALMITCSHACMLLCSHVLTCLACHVCTWKLVFSHAHSWMRTFLIAHMLECSHTTCFDDDMLPSSRALLIKCYYAACFDDNMLPCTHTLIFTCLTSTHMHTLGWLMICLHVWQLKWSWSCTFVHSSALTSVLLYKGNWVVRGMCIWVFQCSYAFCSHACILPLTCLYTLMLKCSHVQLSVTIS